MRALVTLGAALALAVTAPRLAAQYVRVGVNAVGITHTEISEAARTEGAGIGGLVSVRVGRFGLDLSGFTAKLDSVDGGPAFDVLQGDARASVRIATGFAFEVGGGRRAIDPEFSAQDVGYGRVGFLTEFRLASIGGVWGRGAYLVAPTFSGGGSAGFSLELGFGAGIGTSNGRFRGRVEYEFQRLDRTVNQVDVPIQQSVAKLGVDVGF